MERQRQAVAREMEAMAQARIRDEWYLVRMFWEPSLELAVGQAVDQCLAGLRQTLLNLPTDQPAPRAAIKAWLLNQGPTLVRQRIAAGQQSLLEMALLELHQLTDIITVNRLLGNAPDLEGLDGGLAWAKELVGTALEESVLKSYAEFCRRVMRQLPSKRSGDPASLAPRLEMPGQWWRSRLRTIARTVLHAVYNRCQQAVMDSLRF